MFVMTGPLDASVGAKKKARATTRATSSEMRDDRAILKG